MQATILEPTRPTNIHLWTGRVLSAVVTTFLLFDSIIKVLQLRPALEGTARVGYPVSVVFGLGVVELASTVAYATPRTAVLGAILLTGYLGGATATHLRLGEPYFFPVVFGVVVWAGLYLRDRRLRDLLQLSQLLGTH